MSMLFPYFYPKQMRIYGLDFTSAPSLRKPITCVRCRLDEKVLQLETFDALASFDAFEALLAEPGPWVAGMDFPFGQPRKLIENIGWPLSWEGYVRVMARMNKKEFAQTLADYSRLRPPGDKLHLRGVDKLAHAQSPMKLDYVPVGKMFFEGARRLMDSSASILPLRPQNSDRIIFEAYPALVARRWIRRKPYKNDSPRGQSPAMLAAREDILLGLRSQGAKEYYGFDVLFVDDWSEMCIQDGTGDRLDALLCAVQAAWAYSQRDQNFGIPVHSDPLEGWIVDPLLQL